MPIIVDEVVISVEVSNASGGAGAAAPEADKQALIAECVAQVLDILRQQQEP